MEIPGIFFFLSSARIGDQVVVAVGEYYYNNKTKGIEKISNKRKEGRDKSSQGSSKRSIEWRVGPEPKDNAIQTASTLNAFAGENAMFVYELVACLGHLKP
jgi:hypothetical protein